MAWITSEAIAFFLGVAPHLYCAVAFALAPWYAALYETHNHDMHNLLAPPSYIFCVFVFLVASTDIVFRPILLLLLCFMLSGSRRLYLTPVALVLMCLNELLVDGYEQSSPSPENAIGAIKLALDKISQRLWFAWLTAATVFSVLDMVQFSHGKYFSFDVYALLLGILIAVAVALCIASRDPVVAWVATWLIAGLAKETFEMLQTVAGVLAPTFAIVLFIDTIQGLLRGVVPQVQMVTTYHDRRRNAAYGAV
ncbi:hypothetical protein PHYSODRAFT_329275 [Phytophthora sojae]|uniref:Uncharacterized protein n=1 Tax=Phytophthora sojae (strain P6497) TaxID=1094619 RepID=G4ZBT6_PHYSP|nr:hypothetical protein PHYSODRAFT_329275 [Phytophthora sojae]EGZ21290.1 hypothetical protein PHYSODRAFT_329275 [Phytophthora sojae]|eukprot:XP_009524007.1 hypothetical protein PHYSODRAFT_329275 [Phytophthora sojae]